MGHYILSGFILLSIIFASSQDVNSQSLAASKLLKELQAECTNNGIRVNLIFHKPFEGVAYSLGYWDKLECRYISEKQNRSLNYSFLIPGGDCGTINKSSQFDSNSNASLSSDEIYMENTLLIQADATIQEAEDLAKRLRCVWQKEIHKPLLASLPISGNNRMRNKTGSEGGSLFRPASRNGHIAIVPNWKKWSGSKQPPSVFTQVMRNQVPRYQESVGAVRILNPEQIGLPQPQIQSFDDANAFNSSCSDQSVSRLLIHALCASLFYICAKILRQ